MEADATSRYRTAEKIGAGGMGVVWRALDTHLDREVALKFLSQPAVADSVRRERFIREAKAASALNHPNIITIHDIQADGATAFIVMELIHGRDLAKLLKSRKQLQPQEAVRYAVQLADGLGDAHRAGIVHRDIKPSNIMISDDGLVKILDFGLAKLVAPEAKAAAAGDGSSVNDLTATGAAVGTIPYMSLEQATASETDARSDVFSAGVVLYEMLAGRRPFEGPSNPEILRAVLAAEPPPLRSVAPDVPEALADIVHKCLRKLPDERYRDGRELAADLARFDRPASADTAESPAVTIAAAKPAKNTHLTRQWMTVALAGGVAMGGLWIFAFMQHRRHSVTPPPAFAPAASPAQIRDWVNRYDQPGNIDRAVQELRIKVRQQPGNAGLMALLSHAALRNYTRTSNKIWLTEATETGRQAVAANQDLASAHNALGAALAASGHSDEAAAEFQKARDLDPLSAAASLGLAKLRAKSDPPGAEQLYRKAIELGPQDWPSYSEFGTFLYRQTRYQDALQTWAKGLEVTPDNTILLGELAAAHHMLGEYAQAADLLQRALDLDSNAHTWTNLGTARYFQGQYADAVRAFEKAVELVPGNYLYYGNLADAYRWAPGMRAKAAEVYAQAIQFARGRLAVDAHDQEARASLAVYLAKSGDLAGAAAETAALASASDAGTLFKLATIYELTGDRDRALAAVKHAVAAGYSMHEVANEPELANLRSDPRYGQK